MPRHQLTDDEWELIKHLFPAPAKLGRPQRCRRQVVNAILWILRTGAPGVICPRSTGPGAPRGTSSTSGTPTGSSIGSSRCSGRRTSMPG